DAEDPAEVRVDRRLGHLGGQRGPRLAERVLQRVDDERGRNGLGHPISHGRGELGSPRDPAEARSRGESNSPAPRSSDTPAPRAPRRYLDTPQTRAYPAAQWFQPLTFSRHAATCGT